MQYLLSADNYLGGDIIKKVGRPFSNNPKEIRLTVRLDKKHNDIIEKYSSKHNISKNEAVRQGIEGLEGKE